MRLQLTGGEVEGSTDLSKIIQRDLCVLKETNVKMLGVMKEIRDSIKGSTQAVRDGIAKTNESLAKAQEVMERMESLQRCLEADTQARTT